MPGIIDLISRLEWLHTRGYDAQVYRVAGTYTWIKPQQASFVSVFLMPGGMGGDNGGANGAGSGSGGTFQSRAFYLVLMAADLGATETVVVGAGGAGIPAAAAPSGANNVGGFSSFGNHILVADANDPIYLGDRQGNIDYSGAGRLIPGNGGAGGSATNPGDAGVDAGSNTYIPLAGGAGGAVDADGGVGADCPFSWLDWGFIVTGANIAGRYSIGGSGGGGGGGEDSVGPGDGGKGGWPGGGGGGGGEGNVAGSPVGGAGGDGADGVVVVVAYK